jgi:hypothetical protein
MPVKRKRKIKKPKIGRHQLVAAALLFVFAAYVGLLFPRTSSAVRISPRRANYFLGWDIPVSKVPELAKWDMLILDMETQVNSQAALRKIKELNPDIIMLAYITPQEIKTDAATSYSLMRRKLVSGINPNWYLTDIQNSKISFWPGTWMLDIADNAPQINGQRFNQYLAQFVNKEILSTGIWDGVFYDNAWKDVQWIAGEKVDLNKDAQLDTDIDAHWQEGMRSLYQETRRLAGNRFIIMGNATSDVYKNDLNGVMLESFPSVGWKDTMQVYASNSSGSPLPRFMVINANTANKGTQTSNFKKVRYGLASTLMLDGYYAYDYGDQNHDQTWWYDEYDVELGKPLGSALSLNNKPQFEEDVWRREYENGIAIVNATGAAQNVDLGGEYEKITGMQDKAVNNGAIINQINLPAKDGLIMLRTFQTLKNLVFGNGNFVRFFDLKGNRARNGLFIYEEGITGGAKIYYGDLDGVGGEEKIVVTGQKMQIFNSAGQVWFEDFPFSGSYKGELNIAIGKLAGAATDSIVVTQNKGGQAVIYDYHGGVIKEGIFPLGKTFKTGLSVAIAEDGAAVPAKNGQIVVGRGNGSRPEVIIYNNDFSKINRRFFVDVSKIKGELGVAVGDLNGDTKKEIIIAFDMGSSKQIKIYSLAGILLSQFKISASFTTGPVTVGAVDVDFDGKDEVVLMNKQ